MDSWDRYDRATLCKGLSIVKSLLIKGHSIKLTFLSSPKTSKQSAFPLTEPLKCPLSWRNSSRKKRLWGPLFWNCPGSEAMWMWRNSVRLDKLAERRKTNHSWHLSQSQQNLFFPSDYPLMVSWLSSMLLFPCLEYVWVKVIRLKSSRKPEL